MHTFSAHTHDEKLRLLDAVVLTIGISLRLWQYFGNPSLILDELALARNIVGRSWPSLLFSPLDFSQVAPKGFLLAEKAGVTLAGDSEYVLRFFPLLCSLLSLLLFYVLANYILPRRTATFALVLFAFSPGLISYGLEVKQYSSDIAASLVLSYLALRVRLDGPSRARCLALGVASAILVWGSQPAVFIVLGLGLALVLSYWKEGNSTAVRAVLLPGGALAGVSAFVSLVAGFNSMTPATLVYMHRFWHAGFAPLPPHNLEEVFWLWDVFDGFFSRDLHFYWPALYIILMVTGVFFWIRRREAFVWLLLTPVLLTLCCGIAQQYPFSGRLILFLVPCLLLAIAEGAVSLSELIFRRTSWGQWSLAGLLIMPAFTAFGAHLPVYRTEETRPVFSYIEQHHQPGDELYVYYGVGQAFGFYGQQYRLQDLHITVGGCHRGDPHAYLREIDQLRGHTRVWIFFSHSLRIYQEQPSMLAYLERIGKQRDAILVPDREQNNSYEVAAYLYDLSDPERLKTTSAEAYSLPNISPVLGLECTGGPQVPAGLH